MKPRSDWTQTLINLIVAALTIVSYAVVFMFLFASLDKRFGVVGAMGFRESLAWAAAWMMVVALRRGK